MSSRVILRRCSSLAGYLSLLHEEVDDGVEALVFGEVAVLTQETPDGATDSIRISPLHR